jgi:hypothetical protein
MTRWLETDSNTDISIVAATVIGAYTSDADRMVMAQILATNVAGGGDYIYHATLTVGGVAHVLNPKTTATAAAGEVSIGGQSILVAMRNTDILTIYLKGLAGDNVNPHTTVRFFELAALRPTTPDLSLDVSATGEAGLDFANIKVAANPTTLTNITVPTVTDITNDVGLDFNSITQAANPTTLTNITVPTVTDVTNDVGLDFNSITQAANPVTLTNVTVPTVTNITNDVNINETLVSTAVWDDLLAGHLNLGSTGAKLNSLPIATVFPAGAINFTYTVKDVTTGLPIEGVEVWFSTDNPAINIVWKGDTDAFGIARDVNGALPSLDVGNYFVWRQKAGYVFADPDTEIVS